MKNMPIILVAFAVITFILIALLNKVLGTSNTMMAKTYGVWCIMQVPSLVVYLLASDKIEALNQRIQRGY